MTVNKLKGKIKKPLIESSHLRASSSSINICYKKSTIFLEETKFPTKIVTKIFTFMTMIPRKCIFNFKYFRTDDKNTWVLLS